MRDENWLDWYVRTTGTSYRALAAQSPELFAEIDPVRHRQALTDNAFAFRLTVEAAHAVVSQTISGQDVLCGIPPAAIEIPLWQSSLAPFFLETDRAPLAAGHPH